MKSIRIYVALATVLALFIFSRCKKDKTDEPQLPAETAVGAMTFGCKINGKVFVPRDGRGRPGLFCQYVNLGTGPGGGWYLNIPATNWVPEAIPAVNIGTDSLLVTDGGVYQLTKRGKGSASAFYQNGSAYYATEINSGELRINKFDQSNRIIAGTFFFTAKDNSSGQTVNITEGRFDIRY